MQAWDTLRSHASGRRLAVVLAALALGSGGAPAATEKVLHSFAGGPSDGANPKAGLVEGSDGNFYGTTYKGGGPGLGTVFKITPAGAETVLYSFTGSDGAKPRASLIEGSDGNFYGTTLQGGVFFGGTLFKVTPGGAESVLYSFCSQTACTDGHHPAGLVEGSDGNFYGTAYEGGKGQGTVFQVTPSGGERVLHSFAAGSGDGAFPQGGLIEGSDGNFYGTTVGGGAFSQGTVFMVTPGGAETVLYSFGRYAGDGAHPNAGLIEASDGNFYSTATFGGASGNGAVFKVTPGGAESVLYSFTGGSDGGFPLSGLITDARGNLYGTTSRGGASGKGTVFKITPGGAETVLHSFGGYAGDGTNPYLAALVADSKGNLYGTTTAGGASNLGTVFELSGTGFAVLATCKPTDAELANLRFLRRGELTYALSSPTRTMGLISVNRSANIGSYTLPAIQKGGHSAAGGIFNKANASQLASFELQVSFTDPRFACLIESSTATLRITKGGTVEQSFGGIPKSEHRVEVIDGTPGLSQLKISVNGKLFKTLSLMPGGTAHADLSAAMTSEENALAFAGDGSLGSFANVIVSDSLPSQPELPAAQEAGPWGRPRYETEQ
jgi:uncharacterized repeat protein (TIGR03803 family)